MEFRKKFPWECLELKFRTDPLDFVEIEGHTEHRGSNKHCLLRKIECQKSEEWEKYPSAIWVSEGDALYVAFFVADKKGGIDVLTSPNGVPDGTLMLNAKKAGIYTENY